MKRRDLAAGVAAEQIDIGLVPRFDGVGQSLPAFGQSPIERVNVAQVLGESRRIRRRPGRRNVIHLQDLQTRLVLDAHRALVARLAGQTFREPFRSPASSSGREPKSRRPAGRACRRREFVPGRE